MKWGENIFGQTEDKVDTRRRGEELRAEQRKRRETTVNVGGKQVSTSDIQRYKNMYDNLSSNNNDKSSNIIDPTDKEIASEVGNAAYSHHLRKKMYSDPDLFSTEDVYSMIDDIQGTDEYRSLFSDIDKPGSDKNEAFRLEQAKEAYTKAHMRKRGHDLIDQKYNNGDFDTEVDVDGVKMILHPSEEDIAELKNSYDDQVDIQYAKYELAKRHPNGYSATNRSGVSSSRPDEQLQNDNQQRYGVPLGYSRVHEVYGEQDRQRKEEKLNKKKRH